MYQNGNFGLVSGKGEILLTTTYVPIRAGMTLCESISFHFSTENWKPSRDFCQECNEYEEKEVLKNPGVDWTNPEQNLILVKPTFEDGAIGASKTKFSIGSNALIGNKKFQCILMGIKDTFYLWNVLAIGTMVQW